MKGKKHLLSCTEFCQINTEGLRFCGASCLLLLLLPGSWAPGWRISGKLLKTPMREERKTISVCEKSSNSPSIPVSHIQRHCMVILTRRKKVWWNLKVENINFHGFKHSWLWPSAGSVETQENMKTFKTYSFVFELSSDIDFYCQHKGTLCYVNDCFKPLRTSHEYANALYCL